MDFEQLQKSWQSQPIGNPEEIPAVRERVTTLWKKQQRGVMWSNTRTTIGFVLVFVNLAWVYFSFRAGHTFFFGGSILLMYILLFAYLLVIWKGFVFKKNDPTLASNEYLDNQLRALQWRRKTITTYGWIYASLLWLAFMFYCMDVTSGASLTWRIGAPASITAYIFGIQLVLKYTTQKKQLKKIDDLINDLTVLRSGMVE